MKKFLEKSRWCVMLACLLLLFCSGTALASEDDNSLSSLGILTEGAVVSPEFSYNTWSYEVTVPAGTKELSLDPVPSSASATISSISGTTLKEDGTGYVTITVEAGNGNPFTYELNVVSDASLAGSVQETEAETETESETETETETETEDSRYVKVDKNTIQEAENTITDLKGEITKYKDKLNLFTKIMYGLIGLAVVLLFVVINLLLRKKDLKAELNDYRSYGYTDSKAAAKAQKKMEKKQAKPEPMRSGQNGMVQNGVSQNPSQFGQQGHPNQSRPSVKPAAMQNGAAQQAGLDVQPQKSHKKPKQMPQYQDEQPRQDQGQPRGAGQPVGQGQPRGAGQPAVQEPKAGKQSRKQDKGGKKGRGNDVEINMIDL